MWILQDITLQSVNDRVAHDWKVIFGNPYKLYGYDCVAKSNMYIVPLFRRKAECIILCHTNLMWSLWYRYIDGYNYEHWSDGEAGPPRTPHFITMNIDQMAMLATSHSAFEDNKCWLGSVVNSRTVWNALSRSLEYYTKKRHHDLVYCQTPKFDRQSSS